MGSFRDLFKADHQGWIHELVRGEIHPDADRLLQLDSQLDPQQMIEESTIQFLSEMRERIEGFAKLFNSFSEGNAKFQEIKTYQVANTASDFMLYRNQIKLMFTNSAPGVIQIGFVQHHSMAGSTIVDGHRAQAKDTRALPGHQELLAQVGPFRDVFWSFQGEKIVPEQVAKFYFTEFARLTRDGQRSRMGNQLLLDQIKALLQEKGLDL